jgi:hypothetical protein
MSIISAFTQGIGVLNSLANLRGSLRGQVGGTVAGQQQLGALMLPSTYSNLPALPGTGGFTTGGTLSNRGLVLAQGNRPPVGFHYAKDGSGRIVRNRRMNPLNASAARRAIRRIKGARKMLRTIENSLPKRAASKATKRR